MRRARRPTIVAITVTMLLLGALASAPAARADARTPPASGERDYPVTRSQVVVDGGVYTVYRPADLEQVGFDVPIFTWLGGGCAPIVTAGNEKVFSALASAGYFVVAYGSPDPMSLPGPTGDVEQISAAIDWALDQERDYRSPLFQQLDRKRIAVGGMSCGGMASLHAAALDARIDSVSCGCGGRWPSRIGHRSAGR
jgi:hypothetical protein